MRGSIPRPRAVAVRRPEEREREMRTHLYERITRDNVCDYLVAVNDETCSVEETEHMVIINVSAMNENDIDYMESMGVVPDGHTFDRLPDLIVDAYRYRAIIASGEMNRTGVPTCAVCDFVHDKYTVVDPVSSELIEWNVVNDPRPYVLICPECSDD